MRQVLQYLAVGAGLAGLLCALGAGVFTAITASRPGCESCGELVGVSNQLAWAVVAIAAAASLATVWAAFVGSGDRGAARRRRIAATTLALVAVVLLSVYAFSWYGPGGVTRLRDTAEDTLPATQQMWMVPVAVVVAGAGLVVAAVALVPAPVRPGRLGVVGFVVGVVVAVAVSGVATRSALKNGDDSRFVSVHTGASGEVAAWPTRLGQQTFEARWSPMRWTAPRATPRPAGAGFVALRDDPPAVIGYDAAGRERWRYSRTGPGSARLSDFAAFDRGGVVVAKADSNGTTQLTGLDAVTGQPLWSSTDPVLASIFTRSRNDPWSPFLIARGEEQWVAFDPRTGRQQWSIANPVRCPDPNRQPIESLFADIASYNVDSANRLATIGDCSTEDRIEFREFSVDPATGELLSNRVVPVLDRGPRADTKWWYASSWGSDGYAVTLTWNSTPRETLVFVDMPTGNAVDLSGASYWGRSADGGFLMRDGTHVRQYSGGGVAGCEFTSPTDRFAPVAMLADQVVVVDFNDRAQTMLRVFNRSDCLPVESVPAPATPKNNETLTVSVMRGVTLFQLDAQNGWAPILFGYA